MKKRIIAILMMVVMLIAVMMTGCSDAPHNGMPLQATAAEAEIGTEVINTAVIQVVGRNVRTAVRTEAGQVQEEFETVREPEEVQEHEGVQEPVTTSPHVCSGAGGSTITVLAFGQQEPNCFYGAKYDVKCGDCGEYLDIIYREPLGHTGDEGEVTCQPDCTGGGSIRYTCVRCGAEWSEEYGQIQPHAWVEGVKKVTDWENGGTKEIPYLYCSVCGKREGSE